MMAAHHQGQSIVATVLGTAALLLGAGGLFGQLQAALDKTRGDLQTTRKEKDLVDTRLNETNSL